jgi:hypothetical protein
VFDGYDARERKILRRLDSPARIQRFLDHELGYQKKAAGDTCYSPRLVLRKGTAHCMEGALLGALALRRLGYPPLLVDLEAVRDSDHVVAVYRVDGCWGAVAKSDFTELRYREPIYPTVRELALSYFEHYYNRAGEKTLRAYSRPVNLTQFDHSVQWMSTFDEVWPIPEYLCGIAHSSILTRAQERRLARKDLSLLRSGVPGLLPK